MHRSRRAVFALSIALASTGLLSCSSGGSGGASSSSTPTTGRLSLQEFYSPISPIPTKPRGTIVRSEPLTGAPAGSRGWRIIFVTADALGHRALSSGVVYAPSGAPPSGGRPVVAWAHPTIGLSASCAPSMASNPGSTMPFLPAVLAKGWVVAAPDYTGLGTPGILPYLDMAGEAANLVDAVRAAGTIAQAGAGKSYIVLGHSQGGHAALSTASLGATDASELHLKGVVAAAPAAELVALIDLQYANSVAWFIGPEAVASWPRIDTSLDPGAVVSSLGSSVGDQIAQNCLTTGADIQTLTQQFGTDLVQPYFSVNPTANAPWRSFAQANTPPAPSGVPVLVEQGLADTVVLPSTTALLQNQWCAGGADLTVNWVAGASHLNIVSQTVTGAVAWMAGAFSGQAPPSTCSTPPPVAPAPAPS